MKKLLLSLLTVASFSATSFVEAKKQDPSDVCATKRGCKNCKCDDGKICKSKDECNKPKKERAPKKAKVASTKKMSDVVAAPTQRMSDVAAAEDAISDEQY